MFRRIAQRGLGRLDAGLRTSDFGLPRERRATCGAELGRGVHLVTTARASPDQLGPALLADLGRLTILVLALRTLHAPPAPVLAGIILPKRGRCQMLHGCQEHGTTPCSSGLLYLLRKGPHVAQQRLGVTTQRQHVQHAYAQVLIGADGC
jgi:hypothetical protein